MLVARVVVVLEALADPAQLVACVLKKSGREGTWAGILAIRMKFLTAFFCFFPLWFFASNPAVHAITMARFTTPEGTFDVLLYDKQTPLTVANFLNYVRRGDYANTFFHRSVPGFVLQGGGFQLEGSMIYSIAAAAPVPNEPVFSNLRGTIAMAKLGSDPNSATCQWFFNLADNSANLDFQNGGFTVFGRVLGNGTAALDLLAGVPIYDASSQLGPAFGQLPLLQPNLSPNSLLLIPTIAITSIRITKIVHTGSSVSIDWSGSGPHPVDVERATSPAGDQWSVISKANTSGAFTDSSPPQGRGFYRLVLP